MRFVPSALVRWSARWLVFALLACLTVSAAESEDVATIRKWIGQQDGIKTIQTDFKQSRFLKTRKEPLVSNGTFAFQGPDSLRWQVGDPVQEVVLRDGKSLYLISVEKKKAKHIVADKISEKTRMQSLGMMEFPFVKDYADFERQFEVVALDRDGERHGLELALKDKRAARYIKKMLLSYEVKTGNLLAFELHFRDGSKLRNDFYNIRVNEPINPEVFTYDLNGYKVSEEKE